MEILPAALLADNRFHSHLSMQSGPAGGCRPITHYITRRYDGAIVTDIKYNLVPVQHCLFVAVIPVETGIQQSNSAKKLDSGLRRNDKMSSKL